MRAGDVFAHTLFALLLAAPAVAAGQAGARPKVNCEGQSAPNEELRRELLQMERADQAARERWIAEKYSEAAGREMNALDLKHVERLRAIIEARGFPGVCLVGRDAAQAAHTLLLHTPSLELKRAALPHLEAAVRRGEVPAWAAAMLTDDILDAEGKPQLYGTNFEFKDGRLALKPVSDPAGLEERRARVGLPPLSEYIKGLEELYRVSIAPSTAPTHTPVPRAGKKP